MPQNFSLRLRLALLVAGTSLPLILFAVGVVYFNYIRDREAAFERVLETVRGMRLVLDREVQGITSGLRVLALSPALQRDDIKAFGREVDAFLSQYPESVGISLAERNGTQRLNTRVIEGTPLPPRNNMDAVERVFRSGQPAYSRAHIGAVSGKLTLTVNVPVRRNGEVVYDLASSVPTESFQKVIQQQRPDERWTVAIFDQAGINFARVPNPEQTVGRSASPTLLAELFKRDEAKLVTTSLEGAELITAFTRSPLSGWSIAAGMSTDLVTSPLWRALAITGAIGLGMLAIGLGFAVRMASRIARAETLHQLLINELNHRVKNTLATIQSLASQSFRNSPDPAAAVAKFDARLIALSRAHNILSAEKWESANVREIVDGAIDPFRSRDVPRFEVSGSEVRLAPRCALMLSMVVHELATNAAKYGALSTDSGRVKVQWKTTGVPRKLQLIWQESGGPTVGPATRRGFGSRLIEQSVRAQLGGNAKLDFQPSGLVCSVECPLD